MWLEFKSQVETFLKEKGLDDCRINYTGVNHS